MARKSVAGAAKAKAAKQKKIAIGLGVLLALALAYAVHTMMSLNGSSAADKPQVAWLERRLREAGAHEIHTEAFRFQRRWIWRYGAHSVAGIGAAAMGGPVGGGLATAALASVELDISGRSRTRAGNVAKGNRQENYIQRKGRPLSVRRKWF